MDSGDVKEILQSVVIAGILAFLIITFVAQSFVVDGKSMEPNLHDGERLFVNKFIYRF
ncbi:MAG TPA: S26 family signal peptidase, partial [Halanaerobiales bacterium]|nr:S26 family signal peptidase [Halanaerobiales bacterium]